MEFGTLRVLSMCGHYYKERWSAPVKGRLNHGTYTMYLVSYSVSWYGVCRYSKIKDVLVRTEM